MKTLLPTKLNLSVVLPGGCNCNCSFCFWKRDGDIVVKSNDFSRKFIECLDNLPSNVDTISITGGEPTLSSHFSGVIAEISKRRNRWKKVVLTTNGSNIMPHTNSKTFANAIDFINISRHSVSEENNMRVFGKNRKKHKKLDFYDMSKFNLPTDNDLIQIIEKVNKLGVPVNANCILQGAISYLKNGSPKSQIIHFIKWAKEIGFSNVCFRKIYRRVYDLEHTKWQRAFSEYKVINVVNTPTYKTETQIINGININWQYCIANDGEEISELVLHPDGMLCADWGKKLPLKIKSGELVAT